ncbi:hypothetical protein FJT64_021078 [Amphibalanus amphitrite]|uniref:Uncharacterized protein n=1 Tax=Amphibalanus amphitrite TaxID=1232801 RepID=A0A6A4WJP5_AMPAM|nr:hypothetical protein FJT64_007420 [Amphibalanus amphitrite]KAF0307616.1 hypothetical protein FJT64_021078 [Amphibalanus amphitrite]
MKVLVLLCLAALALADDGSYYGDYSVHVPPSPCHGKPGCPGYSGSNVYYRYHVNYPKYGASQGKQETIDASGTRGSYYVEEPNNSIYVSYDHPR